MIILLTVTAIVITGVPLAAVALVAIASRREETARSIAGRAPRRLEHAGRRLLAFHATGIGRGALADDDPALASGLALADDLVLADGATP